MKASFNFLEYISFIFMSHVTVFSFLYYFKIIWGFTVTSYLISLGNY